MTKILVIEDETLRANTVQILEFEDFHAIAAETV